MMKILIFNRHYLPGFKAGGPIRSLANMIDFLGDRIEFFIVTTDSDLLDTVPYPGVAKGCWAQVGKAQVRYLARSERSVWVLRDLIAEVAPDKLYMNSFFDSIFTARLLIALKLRIIPSIPYLIAPRGEFSPGALALRWFRKTVYLSLFRVLKPGQGLNWHASTALEAEDIERAVGGIPGSIRIATDLSAATDLDAFSLWQPRPEGAPLRVCFLSRISPKKNLLGALQALCLVKKSVVFDIYGPQEDAAYWARCEVEIASLPSHVKAHYRGIVFHENVAATIGQYDLFLFPTLGENFGHVIVEALSAGVPVLISDQTPWDDLDKYGAGWVVTGGAADYASRIDKAAGFTALEQRQARLNSSAYAEGVLNSQAAIDQNAVLFD